jgi:hypothetical protein
VRSAILLFALLGQRHQLASSVEPPRVAWTTPNANYPLQVRILTSGRHSWWQFGMVHTQDYGSGNLLGSPQIGFDFNSDCDGGFLHNASAGEFYEGRWKTQDRKIEILMVRTGQTKPEKCTIDVSLKPAPYSKDNPPPHLVTNRQ